MYHQLHNDQTLVYLYSLYRQVVDDDSERYDLIIDISVVTQHTLASTCIFMSDAVELALFEPTVISKAFSQ